MQKCPVELRHSCPNTPIYALSEAFNIFLTQSVLERGIPFEIKIPNDETLEAIKDARANKNMTKVSLEDLKKDLGA